MIVSFGDKATQDIWDGTDSREARSIPKDVWPAARRKLDLVDGAQELRDLKGVGNQLEKLKGELAGFWAIRVNDKYRTIFKFVNGNASDVRIVDYH